MMRSIINREMADSDIVAIILELSSPWLQITAASGRHNNQPDQQQQQPAKQPTALFLLI
jgi:hypothetical protein